MTEEKLLQQLIDRIKENNLDVDIERISQAFISATSIGCKI